MIKDAKGMPTIPKSQQIFKCKRCHEYDKVIEQCGGCKQCAKCCVETKCGSQNVDLPDRSANVQAEDL